RGQRTNNKQNKQTNDLRRKLPRHAKAQAAVPRADGSAKPVCCAQELRRIAPGAAADHPLVAVVGLPGRAVRGSAVVAGVITVLDPLPDIAERVVKAERVRRE